jgi:tRNA pseudouridine55 synthase
MDGVIIVDKKEGMTSFDVVREVRKEYGEKKVGHIGTLDPLASGVLPVLLGKATKLSNFLMEHDKDYIAKLTLGLKTDTGDREGNVILKKDIDESKVTKVNIINVLNSFLGTSFQVPPMYSAIKVNGKKLYELAREGKEVEREKRKIFVSNIDLIQVDGNEITFKVTCSKGTYIRTLCEDIAENLGTCGYMSYLRRTRVGNFRIEDAGKFIPMEEIIPDAYTYNIEERNLKPLLNGVSIRTSLADGICKLYYHDNFIGFGDVISGKLKRKIILTFDVF